jgi:hypothetical protein
MRLRRTAIADDRARQRPDHKQKSSIGNIFADLDAINIPRNKAAMIHPRNPGQDLIQADECPAARQCPAGPDAVHLQQDPEGEPRPPLPGGRAEVSWCLLNLAAKQNT